MMGVPHDEKILSCVNGILKSLECAICLELLQTPVSTGCGHFFCRFCITETLQSNYRKPCPLCKKSFTRRGIQEATQRLTVIKAAKKLAEICRKVTGLNLFPKENSQKICAENLSISKENNISSECEKNIKPPSSRKRKSDERSLNDDALEADMPILSQINVLETPDVRKENFSSGDEDMIPSTKRVCHTHDLSDEDDDDELPSIESLYLDEEKSINKTLKEFEKHAVKAMPNLCADNNLQPTEIKCGKNEISDHKIKRVKSHLEEETNECDKKALIIHRKASKLFSKSNDKNFSKNKKNALKNKTNITDDNDLVKKYANNSSNKDLVNCNDLTENENPLKRNENYTMKPAKKPRNSKSKKIHQKSNSLNSAEEDNLVEKISNAENFILTVENIQNNQNNNIIDGECYELNEITIPCADNDEHGTSNVIKDLKSDEIMDTAISVQAVASPQMGKALSSKSPGWSRVKKVRKDFRVKKFSKLHIEKNNSSNNAIEDIKTYENSVVNTSEIEPKFQKTSEVELMDNNDINMDGKPISNAKDLILESSESPKSENDSHVIQTASKEKLTNHLCEDKNPVMSEFSPRNIDFAVEDFIKEKANNEELKAIGCNYLNGDEIVNEAVSNVFQDHSVLTTASNLSNKTNSVDNIVHVSSNLDSFPIDGEYLTSSNADIQSIAQKESCSNILLANLEVDCYENQTNNVHEVEGHALEKDFQTQSVDYNQPNIVTNVDSENIMNNNIALKEDFTNKQVDSLNTNEFFKPQIGLVKESTISKISKISKCKSPEITAQNEDIYYVEHSQQTSQRLGFYDSKNYNFPLLTSLPLPAPLHALQKHYEAALAPQHSIKENTCAEKTKVVKRTCLTMEEIQDFFTKSNLSGKSETICSLPFLSGNYKLHINVSEETLNVSVLKIVESEICVPDQIHLDTLSVPSENNVKQKRTLMLSEKCIQTSVNNTPILSDTVLPSSNAASEISQSDDDSDLVRPHYNAIPYLSKFFSDSESTPQLNAADVSNIEVKNTTEMLPLSPTKTKLPSSPLQIDETPNNINHKETSLLNTETDVPSKSLKTVQLIDDTVCKSSHVNGENVEMVYISSQDSLVPDADSSILNDFSTQNKKEIHNLKNVSSNEKEAISLTDDLFLKIPEDKNISPSKSAHSTKISDEYDAFFSDPDMAFANELVAPLQNIAKKINSKSNICEKNESKLSVSNVSKNHDDILNYLKENSLSNKIVKHKSSRLSLKQKTNSKFKRIQNFDSDSDESETNKLSSLKQSPTKPSSDKKNKFSSSESRTKSKEISSTTFQDQSTLNSILSDDVNPSEIVQEIEDIDEKIKLLEERLKECGHTDLVSEENLILLKSIREKEMLDSGDSSSEDSDDIFSQSIPPTPPGVLTVNKDSNRKTGKKTS